MRPALHTRLALLAAGLPALLPGQTGSQPPARDAANAPAKDSEPKSDQASKAPASTRPYPLLDAWMQRLLHAQNPAARAALRALWKDRSQDRGASDLALLALLETSFKLDERSELSSSRRRRNLPRPPRRDLSADRIRQMQKLEDRIRAANEAGDLAALQAVRTELAQLVQEQDWLKSPREYLITELELQQSEARRSRDPVLERLRAQRRQAEQAKDAAKIRSINRQIWNHFRRASARIRTKRYAQALRLHLGSRFDQGFELERNFIYGGRRYRYSRIKPWLSSRSPEQRAGQLALILRELDSWIEAGQMAPASQRDKRGLSDEERQVILALRGRLQELQATRPETALDLAARTPYRRWLFPREAFPR